MLMVANVPTGEKSERERAKKKKKRHVSAFGARLER